MSPRRAAASAPTPIDCRFFKERGRRWKFSPAEKRDCTTFRDRVKCCAAFPRFSRPPNARSDHAAFAQQTVEIFDRAPKTLAESDGGLESERPGPGDVGLALPGIVRRQGFEHQFGA